RFRRAAKPEVPINLSIDLALRNLSDALVGRGVLLAPSSAHPRAGPRRPPAAASCSGRLARAPPSIDSLWLSRFSQPARFDIELHGQPVGGTAYGARYHLTRRSAADRSPRGRRIRHAQPAVDGERRPGRCRVLETVGR